MRENPPTEADLKQVEGGYLLAAALSDGRVTALLPTQDTATIEAEGLSTTGRIVIQRTARDGRIVGTLREGRGEAAAAPGREARP